MTKEAWFTYYGKLRGQGRPRFTRKGRAYETKEDREFKEAIAATYEKNCSRWFGTAELHVLIKITRALPKSKPKRIVSEPDTLKPDADNIAKAVLDALNGVAYVDDAQVTSLGIIKNPRSRELDEDLLTVYIEEIERGTCEDQEKRPDGAA